jgi:tripartite-type tricarboxylate transporter receptor subunit TctC
VKNIMKLPHRRQFLHLTTGAAALTAMPRVASAQAYPTRPVRLIVGFPAGGGADFGARLAGQWLSERLGQQFIVENRPGAGTNIATELVVRSPADGYTLLLVTISNAINRTLYEKLNFDLIRDIVPVAGIYRGIGIMVVNPSFPAKNVTEFIAYAKVNPGKISMASGGNGSPQHLSGELFKAMTGVNMVHVSYRGNAPALTDLLGGQVQVLFSDTTAVESIRAGRLRALAVTSPTRSGALPDVPTVGEFVPGYEAGAWIGVGAPVNTPPNVVETLNKDINAGLADPKMKARLADLGYTGLSGSPADFGKLIADETEKWGKVIRTANIKPE